MLPLLSQKEKKEFSTCIRYFANGKLLSKRPRCYLRYEELLTLPVIEVRYLAIKYKIIKPKDWSMNYKVLCQILASFLYSTKTNIVRTNVNGKQVPV